MSSLDLCPLPINKVPSGKMRFLFRIPPNEMASHCHQWLTTCIFTTKEHTTTTFRTYTPAVLLWAAIPL